MEYEEIIHTLIGKLIEDGKIRARLDTNYGSYDCKLKKEPSIDEPPCLYIILPDLTGVKIDRKDMRVYLEIEEEWWWRT